LTFFVSGVVVAEADATGTSSVADSFAAGLVEVGVGLGVGVESGIAVSSGPVPGITSSGFPAADPSALARIAVCDRVNTVKDTRELKIILFIAVILF